ncbi:LCP family protein [Nocardioides pacificus]
MSPRFLADTAAPGARRTVVLVVTGTALVLALVTSVAVVLGYRHLDRNLTVLPGAEGLSDRPSEVAVDGPRRPIDVLVIGSDTRDGEGNGIDSAAGAGGADVTMLLHLSADRERVYGVSLPRDAVVDRPACTGDDGERLPAAQEAMFNTAYAEGGAICAVQTVEQLTGIRLEHWVVVDFNGFVDMVDALDGVTVCIPEEVDDPEHDIHLEAGTREVSGREALDYVRERSVLSVNADLGRMRRQQAFVAAMVSKVFAAETLSGPDRLWGFLQAATRSLALDEELASPAALTDLGMQLRDTGADGVEFVTVPVAEWEQDRNRLVWTDEAESLWTNLRHDRPIGRDLVDGAVSAAREPGEAPRGERAREAARANGLCA